MLRNRRETYRSLSAPDRGHLLSLYFLNSTIASALVRASLEKMLGFLFSSLFRRNMELGVLISKKAALSVARASIYGVLQKPKLIQASGFFFEFDVAIWT